MRLWCLNSVNELRPHSVPFLQGPVLSPTDPAASMVSTWSGGILRANVGRGSGCQQLTGYQISQISFLRKIIFSLVLFVLFSRNTINIPHLLDLYFLLSINITSVYSLLYCGIIPFNLVWFFSVSNLYTFLSSDMFIQL